MAPLAGAQPKGFPQGAPCEVTKLISRLPSPPGKGAPGPLASLAPFFGNWAEGAAPGKGCAKGPLRTLAPSRAGFQAPGSSRGNNKFCLQPPGFPEPQRSLSGALSVSLCGLLRPQDVWRLVEQLRAHLQQAEEDSWASVTVHGFTDSPVSWGEEEHGVLTGGETFYNLLMFQDHAYRLHLATGPQDACPP
ncbi:ribonuclease P protein subunit p40 [Cyprinodon tularosa]|uniref:ribonuclease P protein subunit p40 n=1 Tax=Cyprinodon tularosa TaxID=77115 RepID=UPI0018E21FA8|nr:ribonuclease P protein subunit p40 [Cyprinodon tularosa]